MPGLSAQQVADRVPCPLEQVARLDERGLLDAHREAGQVAPSAVYVVRLMGAFEEAGVPLDDVARAVAAGKLTFPIVLPEPAARDETYDELGARLAPPPELLRRRSRERGRPPSAGAAPMASNPAAHAVYNELHEIYRELHDEFGGVTNTDLGSVMKRLLAIRASVTT